MTTRTCDDWPELMEIAPDLQFKHFNVEEAKLPSDVLSALPGDVPLAELQICCDLDHNVFNPEHTDPRLCDALRRSHWFDLREWVTTGPGSQLRGRF